MYTCTSNRNKAAYMPYACKDGWIDAWLDGWMDMCMDGLID